MKRSRPPPVELVAEAGDLRKVAGFRQDQFDDPAGGAFLEGAETVDHLAEQVFRRSLEALDDLVGVGEGAAHRLADHGLEEFFLVLEVDVGKSLADRGCPGDVLELGRGESPSDEQVERGRARFPTRDPAARLNLEGDVGSLLTDRSVFMGAM